jgi:hypothetical protein
VYSPWVQQPRDYFIQWALRLIIPTLKTYITSRASSFLVRSRSNHGHGGVRGFAQTVDRDRSCNVAKLGFEWSSFIERRGRRRQPLVVAVGAKQDASQFVTQRQRRI